MDILFLLLWKKTVFPNIFPTVQDEAKKAAPLELELFELELEPCQTMSRNDIALKLLPLREKNVLLIFRTEYQ